MRIILLEEDVVHPDDVTQREGRGVLDRAEIEVTQQRLGGRQSMPVQVPYISWYDSM